MLDKESPKDNLEFLEFIFYSSATAGHEAYQEAVCFPNETMVEETKSSFASSYPLVIPSLLEMAGMGGVS